MPPKYKESRWWVYSLDPSSLKKKKKKTSEKIYNMTVVKCGIYFVKMQ